MTEAVIFELSVAGRRGTALGELDVPVAEAPGWAARKRPPRLPEMTEGGVVRHYTRLSRLNFSVDTHFYPLGSCTMKHNPRANERLSALLGLAAAHPYQDDGDVQGLLEILWELERCLCEIAGLAAATLQPAAGAHGELAGMMMIAAYQRDRGEGRDVVLIPESAHGTNPASAATCGLKAVAVKPGPDGRVDIEDLRRKADGKTAALMITNPSTLGIFDSRIADVTKIVHDAGGLVYMDGANLNAIMGIVRPGDFGVDVMHFNLHKTFGTPHGCGGPGSGPVAVSAELEEYLPGPLVEKCGEGFRLVAGGAKSIGRVRTFIGNAGVLVKAWLYIRAMGGEGLRRVSEAAVLNSDYLRNKLVKILPLGYQTRTHHEFVLTGKALGKYGVRVLDVAKRLLDYGFHPPTIYFPLIVDEAMMVEPTETESQETLDAFAEALGKIIEEAHTERELLTGAPHTMPVGRLDEVRAVKEPKLSWWWGEADCESG